MAELTAEPQEFRTEVRKLLGIITNSLYTNREIFLRELISNASDALDKLRFQQNRGQTPREASLPLEIRITLDKAAKTLTIRDTGIGMTRQELADNLGTIAKSGSEAFLAALAAEKTDGAGKDGKDGTTGEEGKAAETSNVIGRFGVGFYAVFMVADKVEVTSRPAFEDAPAFTWVSDGQGSFQVLPCTGDAPERGTVIVAHLKDTATEFLERYRCDSIIRTHSAFIPFPIFVNDEQVNTTPALWREPRFSISKEQYADFYTFLTLDNKAPLDSLHFAVDAPVQFTALLFIPDAAQDFYGPDRDHWGLDLYARRVLIQRANKDLLPEYLAFFKGVVDTEDLPLNISRETLQENVVLRKIAQTITRQALSHLEKLAKDDPERYNSFWKHHGKVFKLGYSDYAQRERVAALLRYNTSLHENAEALSSLDDYQRRAPEGQKTFWYVAAPNREAARLTPHLEIFRRKGIEVLFLYEPLDEFVMEGLGTYKEWDFKAVERADESFLNDVADTGARPDVAPLAEDDLGRFDALLARMKELLGDMVTDVRVSHRLADSPACLVTPDGAMTSSMDKLFRIMNHDDSIPKKVLEVNRDHPLLRTLLRIHKADAQDALLAELVRGLYDTSLLLDGYLKDPQTLATRTNKLLEQAGAWYAEVKKIN